LPDSILAASDITGISLRALGGVLARLVLLPFVPLASDLAQLWQRASID
jgi:hypothetical protein